MRQERTLATRPARVRGGMPQGFKVPEPRPNRCRHCKGTGKRAAKKGHKPDCACIACQPCKACNGTRLESGVLRSKPTKELEVGEIDMTDIDDEGAGR